MSQTTLSVREMSYQERAKRTKHPLAKRLLNLMEEKKTNLAHNPDVTSAKRFLEIADQVGPHICILKTHIDILEDFDVSVTEKLKALAEKHHFLIFEDRKFVDIGSVVLSQYEGGIYRISDWAHIVNANHIMPGPGVIKGLAQVGQPKGRGLFLIAEMSSERALWGEEHRQETARIADQYEDFVMGIICQTAISENPGMIHFTPGVQKAAKGDALGQKFRTPHEAIFVQGNDVMTVGRGIYKADNIAEEAKEYQNLGWNAYLERIAK